MLRFIVRRSGQTVIVLFGASIVLFLALYVLPGDPLNATTGRRPRTESDKQELERRYGLDKPIVEQYVNYVSGLLQGDFGDSFRHQRPVTDVINDKVWQTARLASAAIALELFVGVIVGIIAALRRHTYTDTMITVSTIILVGLPTFAIGTLLRNVFSIQLHWLPGNGQGTLGIVLPAITLAAIDLALMARLMRGSMIDTLRADYIRTARAKGLTERAVLWKHTVRTSLLPIVTYTGIALGTLLGGALITEVLFDWDGIGTLMSESISSRDNPVILAIATYGVLAFVIVNMIVDIIYAWLDPRIRLE